jgi:hypothetical protein
MLSAGDFKRIQNTCNETIHLRYEILCCAHCSLQTTWLNKGLNEEPVIKLVFACDGMVYVNLLRFPKKDI